MRTLFTAAFFFISLSTFSQTYKPFKVDAGIGFALPLNNGIKGNKAGATLTIEPHNRVTDNLSLGIRFEGAGLGNVDNSGTVSETKFSLLMSYCATAEYYFNKDGLRPFAGLGAGLYLLEAFGSNPVAVAIAQDESKFIFFPRLGFEINHFRMSTEYNFISNNNYLAFKVGWFFGGGKK